jgi:hypothetical protein
MFWLIGHSAVDGDVSASDADKGSSELARRVYVQLP